MVGSMTDPKFHDPPSHNWTEYATSVDDWPVTESVGGGSDDRLRSLNGRNASTQSFPHSSDRYNRPLAPLRVDSDGRIIDLKGQGCVGSIWDQDGACSALVGQSEDPPRSTDDQRDDIRASEDRREGSSPGPISDTRGSEHRLMSNS